MPENKSSFGYPQKTIRNMEKSIEGIDFTFEEKYFKYIKEFVYFGNVDKKKGCEILFAGMQTREELDYLVNIETKKLKAQWGYFDIMSKTHTFYIAEAVGIFSDEITVKLYGWDEGITLDVIKQRTWTVENTYTDSKKTKLKISDIVTQIAIENGLQPDVEETQEIESIENFKINQNSTDEQFLKELALKAKTVDGREGYIASIDNGVLSFKTSKEYSTPQYILEYRKEKDGIVKYFLPVSNKKDSERKGAGATENKRLDSEAKKVIVDVSGNKSKEDIVIEKDKKEKNEKHVEVIYEDESDTIGTPKQPPKKEADKSNSNLIYQVSTNILLGMIPSASVNMQIINSLNKLSALGSLNNSGSIFDILNLLNPIQDPGSKAINTAVIAYKYFNMQKQTKISGSDKKDQTEQTKINNETKDAKFEEIKASLQILGIPDLDIDNVIIMTNTCDKYDGPYYIEDIRHVINSSGYLVTCGLKRDATATGLPNGDSGNNEPNKVIVDVSGNRQDWVDKNKGKVKFIWPCEGKITSAFGWRIHPKSGLRKFHEGIDISVPTGTGLSAAADGTVVSCTNEGGYGKTVIIKHDGGYLTRYAHLSNNSIVKSGATVKQGQLIGLAGSTGYSTGSHLHFEIIANSNKVNPANYTPKGGGSYAKN